MKNLIMNNVMRAMSFTCLVIAIIAIGTVRVNAETVLEFDKEGNLTITTEDRIATSNLRYKTLGWTIKEKKEAINAKGNHSCRIRLEQYSSRPSKRSGYVITVFKVSKEEIFESINESDSKWANRLYKGINESGKSATNYVYFDGIMTVVENGVAKGSLSSKCKPSGEVYFTESGIKSARSWADKNALSTHFNIPVKFNPNEKMLAGKCTISYIEATSRNNLSEGKSLKRLGHDKTFQLKQGENVIEVADLTSKGFTYLGGRVSIKKWSDDASKVTGFGADKLKFSYDNAKHVYQNIIIKVYFIRNVAAEEAYTTARDIDEMSKLAKVRIYSDEYDVETAVPSGEMVNISADIQKYGLNAVYLKHSGVVSVPITVAYTDDEDKVIYDTVYVDREYSYYTVEDAVLEDLTQITVYNDALSGGQAVITAPKYELETDHHEEERWHIRYPSGILWVSSAANAQAEAESYLPYLPVRNDGLSVNGGKTYLSSSYCKGKASEPVHDGNYYTQLQTKISNISVVTANGEHESAATANYCVTEISTDAGNVTADDPHSETAEVSANNMIIHTPIVCIAHCSDDIAYNQQKSPTKYKSLILGRTVRVSITTTGAHTSNKGYGKRNYEKYCESRYVKFPFDVVLNGEKILADTWTLVEAGATVFTIPIYVKEGDYTIEFKDYAYNVSSRYDGMQYVEKDANMSISSYGATDSIRVCVMGRVFGFEVTDIVDYPRWKSVFREADGVTWSKTTYKSGDRNKDGEELENVNLLPIINGSHPFNTKVNGIGMGYRVKFRLSTIGNFDKSDGRIAIVPQFYYTTDGTHQTEVDLYYNEKIDGKQRYMVKVGSELDLQNVKRAALGGDGQYCIATDEELKAGEYIYNAGRSEAESLYTETGIYSYGLIMLTERVKTFAGCGRDNFALKTYMAQQTWYGEYSLPKAVYVVPKGTKLPEGRVTGNEGIFLKGGYIVVKFNIYAIRDGLPNLLYENAVNAQNGYCNMWETEGFKKIRKTLSGDIWLFENGQVLVYDRKNGLNKDYFSQGTH